MTLPDFLGDTGKAWVSKVLRKYSFTADEQEAVFQAGVCLDRIAAAQVVIKKKGVTVPDRYGILKMNPAIIIERDARTLFLKACNQLGITSKGVGNDQNSKK